MAVTSDIMMSSSGSNELPAIILGTQYIRDCSFSLPRLTGPTISTTTTKCKRPTNIPITRISSPFLPTSLRDTVMPTTQRDNTVTLDSSVNIITNVPHARKDNTQSTTVHQHQPNADNQLTTIKLPTPVNPNRLNHYLDSYDPELKNYIVQGFKTGFTIHAASVKNPVPQPANSLIAQRNPQAVREKIHKELHLGHIAGPFQKPPFDNFRISPLFLRSKDKGKGWRLLHDLSYPYSEDSINSTIPDNYKKVKYSSITTAINKIQQLGLGTYLAKSDIQSAFTLVPITPKDYHKLGFQWEGLYYYYTTLPQGAASSCFIFERIATAIHWILTNHYNIQHLVHYLDDFLFLDTTRDGCHKTLNTFHKLCEEIGIPINHNKTEGPSISLSFLGIQLDTIANQASLPLDKVNKYTDLMQDFLNRKTVRLHEMQKVIGSLQFTTSVVTPGRTFLRRLINSTIGIQKPYHRIHITRAHRDDIIMWLDFLTNFNGITIFLDTYPIPSTILNLYTDSCPQGYGGTYGNRYFYGYFPDNWKPLNIAVLELYPILLAVHLFSHNMSNKHIVFYTDNIAVSEILKTKTTKHPQLLKLLRILVLHTLKHNILFTSQHIKGKNNILPDALSRNTHTTLMLQEHHMDIQPIDIPDHLQPHNFKW